MKATNLIAIAIVGVCAVLAFLAWSIFGRLSGGGADSASVSMADIKSGLDAQAVQIGELRVELDQAKTEIKTLKAAVDGLQLRPDEVNSAPLSDSFDSFGELEFEEGAVPTTEALSEQMKLAKERFNKAISQPKNSFMLESLGQPREDYSTDCQGVSNPRLKAALETREIANFKLTMLRPALDSVQRIIQRLKDEEPEIYAALGTAGAMCARFIRGSTTSISNHSWGAAVDLTLEGNLDAMGDGGTQFGLVILAEFFNDEGWYWGAGYGREDSMHFEVGEELLRGWIAEGKL